MIDDGETSAQIAAALDGIERAHDVRILFAVESGSRAWGFASRDSDWDVRFVFVRPLAAYLSVEAAPLDIVLPLDGALDIVGWDLRKALGLVARSNAAVLEWIRSPIVYRAPANGGESLAALAATAAHLPALAYHYDRLACHAWRRGRNGTRRLKDIFYALRPSLALAWMRAHGTPPPMDLVSLMEGAALATEVVDAIAHLRLVKAAGTEGDRSAGHPAVCGFIEQALTTDVARPAPWDRAAATIAADALFRRCLGLPE